MTEYELERDVRDAIGSRIYSGTSEIQRNIIAAVTSGSSEQTSRPPTCCAASAARSRTRSPSSTATGSLTYASSRPRSNRLAHAAARLGVRRGDRVGLYLDKSLESLVGDLRRS